MAKSKKTIPDFFSEGDLDPVSVATGGLKGASVEEKKLSAFAAKKKAGFYLAADLLERFDRTFYQLKIEGVGVVNKSALVEAALTFALKDMEKGEKSAFRKIITGL